MVDREEDVKWLYRLASYSKQNDEYSNFLISYHASKEFINRIKQLLPQNESSDPDKQEISISYFYTAQVLNCGYDITDINSGINDILDDLINNGGCIIKPLKNPEIRNILSSINPEITDTIPKFEEVYSNRSLDDISELMFNTMEINANTINKIVEHLEISNDIQKEPNINQYVENMLTNADIKNLSYIINTIDFYSDNFDKLENIDISKLTSDDSTKLFNMCKLGNSFINVYTRCVKYNDALKLAIKLYDLYFALLLAQHINMNITFKFQEHITICWLVLIVKAFHQRIGSNHEEILNYFVDYLIRYNQKAIDILTVKYQETKDENEKKYYKIAIDSHKGIINANNGTSNGNSTRTETGINDIHLLNHGNGYVSLLGNTDKEVIPENYSRKNKRTMGVETMYILNDIPIDKILDDVQFENDSRSNVRIKPRKLIQKTNGIPFKNGSIRNNTNSSTVPTLLKSNRTAGLSDNPKQTTQYINHDANYWSIYKNDQTNLSHDVPGLSSSRDPENENELVITFIEGLSCLAFIDKPNEYKFKSELILEALRVLSLYNVNKTFLKGIYSNLSNDFNKNLTIDVSLKSEVEINWEKLVTSNNDLLLEMLANIKNAETILQENTLGEQGKTIVKQTLNNSKERIENNYNFFNVTAFTEILIHKIDVSLIQIIANSFYYIYEQEQDEKYMNLFNKLAQIYIIKNQETILKEFETKPTKRNFLIITCNCIIMNYIYECKNSVWLDLSKRSKDAIIKYFIILIEEDYSNYVAAKTIGDKMKHKYNIVFRYGLRLILLNKDIISDTNNDLRIEIKNMLKEVYIVESTGDGEQSGIGARDAESGTDISVSDEILKTIFDGKGVGMLFDPYIGQFKSHPQQ